MATTLDKYMKIAKNKGDKTTFITLLPLAILLFMKAIIKIIYYIYIEFTTNF